MEAPLLMLPMSATCRRMLGCVRLGSGRKPARLKRPQPCEGAAQGYDRRMGRRAAARMSRARPTRRLPGSRQAHCRCALRRSVRSHLACWRCLQVRTPAQEGRNSVRREAHGSSMLRDRRRRSRCAQSRSSCEPSPKQGGPASCADLEQHAAGAELGGVGRRGCGGGVVAVPAHDARDMQFMDGQTWRRVPLRLRSRARPAQPVHQPTHWKYCWASARWPEVSGVAMEVPDILVRLRLQVLPLTVLGVEAAACADVTVWPGAARSGLMRPSSMGP
jgi:hypothetical protein